MSLFLHSLCHHVLLMYSAAADLFCTVEGNRFSVVCHRDARAYGCIIDRDFIYLVDEAVDRILCSYDDRYAVTFRNGISCRIEVYMIIMCLAFSECD